MTEQPGFSVRTDDRHSHGFHVTFANGYTVSVQFGKYSYCGNRTFELEAEAPDHCVDAEVAAWGPDGKWLKMEGDDVIGWQTPEQVLAIMNMVAAIGAPS